jgi:histidinol-phosphatase
MLPAGDPLDPACETAHVPDSPAALLDFAHRLVDETDGIALGHFAGELTITAKHDRTLVTQADTEVETRLRERIAAEFPHHGILGEEFGTEPGDGETRWIIDPIDGTHNFVRGIPIWATLLAVERDGKLVTALVSAPALRQRWTAVRGRGAGTRENGVERAIQVSQTTQLGDAQILFSTLRSIDAAGRGQGLRSILDHAWRDRGFGDFWGYMLVAQGSAEAMIEVGPRLWDLAAPSLIVTEAGGQMTDMQGNPGYGGPTALASNGHFHGELVELLREADQGTPA